MTTNYLFPALAQCLQVHANANRGIQDLSVNCRRVEMFGGPEPNKSQHEGVYSWDFQGTADGSIYVVDSYGFGDPITSNEDERSFMIRIARPILDNAAVFGVNNGSSSIDTMWGYGTDFWRWDGVSGNISGTPTNGTQNWTTLFFELGYSSFAGGSFSQWFQDDASAPFQSISRNFNNHIVWDCVGRHSRGTGTTYPPFMRISEFAAWDRRLTQAEREILSRDFDVLLKRQPQYIPRVTAPPSVELAADLTQAETLTADLTVTEPAKVSLQTALTQSETVTADLKTLLELKGVISQTETIGANLTVNLPGVVDLKTVLSQTEDLTADLTVIPPPQVALATTLTQTEAIAADLTVNVPGMVSLQASLSQSESLAPDLTILDPPPTLQTLLTQSESIFATLTIEGATAASAVEYRAPDLQTHYRAPDLQTNYRGT